MWLECNLPHFQAFQAGLYHYCCYLEVVQHHALDGEQAIQRAQVQVLVRLQVDSTEY